MRKAIDWHAQCLIPELLYFQNGCDFTGSVSNEGEKEFRYKLSPVKAPEDCAETKTTLRAEAWYGPFCYEKSTVFDQSEFPMDEEGRSAAIDWLSAEYKAMIPESKA